MRNKIILLTILILCLYNFCPINAEEDTTYQSILQYSPEELFQKAERFKAESQEDSAHLYYSIILSRYNDQITPEEGKLYAQSANKAGVICYYSGNYTGAFNLYIEGLKIAEKSKYVEYMPNLYINLGNIYSIYQDYEIGRSYYEKALNLNKQYKNPDIDFKILTNLVQVCCFMKDTQQANKYFKEIQFLHLQDSVFKQYFDRFNLGLIYVTDNQSSKGIYYLKQSVDYCQQYINDPAVECSSLIEISKAYQQVHRLDSALYYSKLCYELARKNQVKDMLIQSLKDLSDLYERKGDLSKSLACKSEYLSQNDSIFNIREFNKIKKMQFLYETEKTNNEIAMLNKEREIKALRIKQQNKILFSIALGLLITAAFLVILYRQKRKLQETYQDLFQRNREIMLSEEIYKKIHLRSEARIKELENKLKELQPEENIQEKETDEDDKKYQKSNLNDEQKEILLEAINHVMEDTLEFCNVDFSLEKLASLVNSNSRYVYQVINETYHKNFNLFINEYRIKEVRKRLMDTENYSNYTIKAIAESVGYKSHANFVLIFKKYTGITPSMFQKMANK